MNFTKYPNIILDNLHLFNGNELKILSLMIRKNYGYQSCNKEFSFNYVAKKLNMSTTTVQKSIKTLLDIGIIKRSDSGKRNISRYEICVETFNLHPEPCQKMTMSENDNVNNCHTTMSKNDIEPCQKMTTLKETILKETILKETNSQKFINIINSWNTKNLQKHKESVVYKKFKKKHFDVLKEYGEESIISAINNYDVVVNNSLYFFNYKWPLWDFLTRGIEKFIDEAQPLVNFKIRSKKTFNEQNAFLDFLTDEQFDMISDNKQLGGNYE